jgi:hypothetical protein
MNIQLFVGRIIPDVSEDQHVMFMLKCQRHIPEGVHCSNIAVKTTNMLIKYFYVDWNL